MGNCCMQSYQAHVGIQGRGIFSSTLILGLTKGGVTVSQEILDSLVNTFVAKAAIPLPYTRDKLGDKITIKSSSIKVGRITFYTQIWKEVIESQK